MLSVDLLGPLKASKALKIKIFNFELKGNLDLHIDVKFDGERDGDGPDSLKPHLDPLNGPYIDPLSTLLIQKSNNCTGKRD